jgi:N-acyl-D-aspartate/D-glutamate deacylase
MFDILIKNGTLIDGTGTPRRGADVAIHGGKIVAVEAKIEAEAAEIVDVTGAIVTPGFIDVHTHYDAQVTWDDQVLPSSAHGVTTVIIGNCGIGFAPIRPGTEDWLISLTEGVEDIPGSVLHEGIHWSWESFPEYLDFLGSRKFALDVAAHMPHSALRAYVMGKRTLDNAPATDEDLKKMAALTREAIAAGAIGFATSRLTTQHFGSDGKPLPGTTASEAELSALVNAMSDGGGGVMQIAPFVGGQNSGISTMGATNANTRSLQEELAMIRRLAASSGRPITFSLAESFGAEDIFKKAVETLQDIYERGEPLAPQFTAKPIAALSTLDGYHAFMAKPGYQAIAHLSLEERVQRMRDPAFKTRLMSENDLSPAKHLLMNNFPAMVRASTRWLYPFDADFDYEPDSSRSIAALAGAARRDPLDYLYDYMLEDGGRSILVAIATNYSAGDLRVTEQLLRDERTLIGVGDGGAHVRAISDASQPTYVLTHWARDRHRGPTLPLEMLIRKQSFDAASFYGLNDRGVIMPGRRADLNVIDVDRLSLGRPHLVADLPAGGMRFLQDADGYVMTMVAGAVTRRNDRDTGARPGRLVRGTQTR